MARTALFQSIKQCKNCNLHCNQPPLLDIKKNADVIWVGLSAVRVEDPDIEPPLSGLTNSGRLLQEIERLNSGIQFYRTNLVKCLPESSNKIRYPKQSEMQSCSSHLDSEIRKFKPKVVVLLGKQVSEFVSDETVSYHKNFKYKPKVKNGTAYICVEHPSYILVYKRRQLERYIKGISKMIQKFVNDSTAPKSTTYAMD